MKTYKIILSWLTTVLMGSICLPLIGLVINSIESNSLFSSTDFGFIGLAVLIAVIMSSLLSLPTLITLIIRNAVLPKKRLDIRTHYRKISRTHLLVAFINILLFEFIYFLYLLNTYNQMHSYLPSDNQEFYLSIVFSPILMSIPVCLWYGLVAFASWRIFFRQERNMKSQSDASDSVLDQSV